MLTRNDDSKLSRFSDLPQAQEEGQAEQYGRVETPAMASSDEQNASLGSPATPRPGTDVNLGIGPAARSATQHGRGQAETLISKRSSFDGTLRTDDPVRVRGTVQGCVESKSFVIVEEQGRVTAKVTAAAVTVAGQVDGHIVCTERAELMPTAHVTGEITAPTAIIREGAYFDGELKMGSSSEQASTAEGAIQPRQ